MADLHPCKTCKHDGYGPEIADWIICDHPATLQKRPRWEEGDPAAVNAMTADVRVTEANNLRDCPAHEPREVPHG